MGIAADRNRVATIIIWNNTMLEKFKDISSFFSGKNTLIEKSQKEIKEKVDFFIINNMLDMVVEYRSTGYVLTGPQNKKFKEKYDNLSSHEKLAIINNAINNGLNVAPSVLLESFSAFAKNISNEFNSYDLFVRKSNRKPLQDIFSQYEKNLENNTMMQTSLYDDMTKKMNRFILRAKLSSISSLYQKKNNDVNQLAVNLGEELDLWIRLALKHASLEQKTTMMTKCEKMISTYGKAMYRFAPIYEHLKKDYQKVINDETTKDKENIKLLYSNTNLETLMKDKGFLDNKKNLQQLPLETREILDNLTKNYIFLTTNIESLDIENKFKLENLWERRVPEVISKYLKADPEFREKNKDGQESLKELTIASLKNIEKIFVDIKDDLNEKTLNEASALKRYISAL